MNLYKVFLPLFLILTNVAFSQNYELGKVTIDELNEKQHPIDTSAVAAILFQVGDISYPFEENRYFSTLTTVKTKIKIYKKEGLEYANQMINYYSGENSRLRINFSNATTYNLVDGKIEKTLLKDDGEFKTNINKYWTQKIIAMPNVKIGSIIEFQYKIVEYGIGTPSYWSFQKQIPTNYSKYVTQIPEYFIFGKKHKGFIFPKITTQNILDKSQYKETKTTYLAENMPAMKVEKFVNNIENYTSSVSHELTAINIPGRYLKEIANGWDAITKTIYQIDSFNNELNKTSYFEEDIKELINGQNNRDEKINTILDFVKKKVKWNNSNSFLCNYGVKNAYKDGVGNSAEINLMLISMLRYAGLEANPILISTRSNGLVLFPSISSFNHVICGVEIENDIILLDATEKFASPNLLPFRDLNHTGRLIRKEGNSSTEIDLTPKLISRNISNLYYTLNSDGNAEGKIRMQYTDYCALEFRENNLNSNLDNYLDKLENKNGSIEIYNYKRDNDFSIDKPIIENYDFKDNKNIEIYGDKLLLSPLLFLSLTENPFKQDKREYPIDFGYPTDYKYNINIEIPSNYSIESIPESLNLTTDENLASFKYIINKNDNKVQISIITSIKIPIIPADHYEIIKNFYKEIIEKQNEKIILKKL